MTKMTRWGIGPLFALLTMCYAAIIYGIDSYVNLKFEGFEIVGINMILIGFLIFIYPAVTIDKYFNKKELRMTGLYRVCRHPIYASWILIIIPGIVLVSGSYLAISIPIVSYFILKKLIVKEESYMLSLFPNAYKFYKTKVNMVFPTKWLL